jgi:hypothetical protein
MEPDSLIFEGTAFLFGEGNALAYSIRTAVISAMAKREFRETGHPFQGTTFTTMNFLVDSSPLDYATFFDKIKKSLNLISEAQFERKTYRSFLENRLPNSPFNIEISLRPGQLQNHNGLIFYVVCKPALYCQNTQLGWKIDKLSYNEYKAIQDENTRFIKDIFGTFSCRITDEPHPRARSISNISETLKRLKFDKIAKLLEDTQKRIDMNDPTCLDDLRGAIENFLVELVKRLGKSPAPQRNPDKNLEILKAEGLITSKNYDIINKVLIKQVWGPISGLVHERPEWEKSLSNTYLMLTKTIFEDLINALEGKIRL